MTKLTRVPAKVFASSAISTEIGQFGSAVAGSKLETSDVATIQGLSAWLSGWSEALVSGNRYPALQEMNGLLKVLSYQGAYALQEGIAEYDSATTYYIGSIVKKTGTFELYGSLTDDNVGNALTVDTEWKFLIDLANINNWTIIPTGTCSTATNELTLTGTVTATNGSTTITGSGTSFTTQLAVGEAIIINGTPLEIATITSNTSLTVYVAYANATGSYTAYKANRVKIVDLPSFELVDGAEIDIIFTNQNMDFYPAFNVNNKGNITVVSQTGVSGLYHPLLFTAGYPIRFKYYSNFNNLNHRFVHQRQLLDTVNVGTSWVKLYSDGWIEQGSLVASGTSTTVEFISPFKNTHYSIIACANSSTAGTSFIVSATPSSTTRAIVAASSETPSKRWEAKGY